MSEVIRTYFDIQRREYSSNAVVKVEVSLNNKGQEQHHKTVYVMTAEKKVIGDPLIARITAFLNNELDKSQTWEDEYDCEVCEDYTMHICYTTGHERDSSGDRRTCKTCGNVEEL